MIKKTACVLLGCFALFAGLAGYIRAEEQVLPFKVVTDVRGARGNEYTCALDGDLSTYWKPEVDADKIKPRLQFYFDSRVTITSIEIAQGYEDAFLYKAPYRIKEILIYYADGMSQKVRCKDTSQPTAYKLKKNDSYFLELEFKSFYANSEGWYFLLREIKFFGSMGKEKIPRQTVDITFAEFEAQMNKIFNAREKFSDEFPSLGQFVIWPGEIKNLTAPFPEAGAENFQINPTFSGGEPDEDGWLDEEYMACVFFDNPQRSKYAMFDAKIRFKNRLEWSKAQKCCTDGIAFKVQGMLLKPLGADQLMLDEAAIVAPKLDKVQELPLPVPTFRRTYRTYDELVPPLYDATDLPFYVYDEAKTELPANKTIHSFYVILGRPGFGPGEWQTPPDAVDDIFDFAIRITTIAGAYLAKNSIVNDWIRIGYKFKYYSLRAADVKKLLVMDTNKTEREQIYAFYKKNMQLD